MSPRPRDRRLPRVLALVCALVILGASAASLLGDARLVDVVALAGSAFAAGATAAGLRRNRGDSDP